MIREFDGITPEIDSNAYVDEQAYVAGDVRISEGCGIFPGASLRGDEAKIILGKNSNVQDNATIHVTTGMDTVVGEGVTVGHNAILHSCTVEDNVLVGMGAIVLDGAYIESDCIIGAGCLVSPNKRIPRGSLVVGVPGNIVRQLSEKEIEGIKQNADDYVKLAEKYKLDMFDF